MAFGMSVPTATDFADIVKYDARAGRMFRVDYDQDTRQKTSVDITMPAPRFAVDFGSLEIGYGRFTPTGPDLKVVPEGQPLPAQPTDKDDKGKLAYRPVFRVKLYGKVLGGLREWASTAGCVLEAVDDLYNKFKTADQAAKGQIPIVEMTKTIPVAMGRGANQSTVYTPCFAIVGWTDRVSEMGTRTVPAPKAIAVAEQAVTMGAQVVTLPTPVANTRDDLNDNIPF